jgi:hypothetical protein
MAQCLGNLWKNCSLIKGLISGLILFGTGRQAFFFQKECSDFLKQTYFGQKNGLPKFLATIANLPNNAWVQNNLDLFLAQ